MNHSNHFDIIIVGAGLVGLTFACALRDSSLTVAIVDGKEGIVKAPPLNHYSTRVSAITRASQSIFTNLQVWSAMQAARISAYTKMCVWETDNTPLWFDCAQLTSIPIEENLGHIIENEVMQAALIDKLKDCVNVTWICPVKPTQLSYLEHTIKLGLDNVAEITGKLLVGADGAHSWVRQQTAIADTSWDYDHHALITNVQTELAHEHTAWQCFLPSGPVAFLPLANAHSCSIVWSSPPEYAKKLSELPVDEFQQELAKAFDYRLGSVYLLGERTVIPLRMRHAQQYVKPKVALIGDAAHTLHPLAGQGVNLGLLDAASLAEVILAAHDQQKDIGALLLLRRYERWRKGHNLAMIAAMEGLKRIFASERVMIKLLRRTGMQWLDHLPPAKRLLMSYALGLQGDLPKLATYSPK